MHLFHKHDSKDWVQINNLQMCTKFTIPWRPVLKFLTWKTLSEQSIRNKPLKHYYGVLVVFKPGVKGDFADVQSSIGRTLANISNAGNNFDHGLEVVVWKDDLLLINW